VNNAVARVAGLLWIAALPPLTGLTGAAYTDPAQFRSSFAQISWIARPRSSAPRCSPPPSSPGLPAPPPHHGQRSSRPRCPTSPARSPPATHPARPAGWTAARQATPPVPPVLRHRAAPDRPCPRTGLRRSATA
jgi:hypothetical protein